MADRQSELNTGSTSGATPEQIRDDIRRTRANMDETVDAIGERMRPRHLLDDVIDLFRSPSDGAGSDGSSSPGMADAAGVAKDLGASAMRKMKNHPMPAALISAGIVWLLFDESSGAGGSRRLTRDDVRGQWRDEELRERGGSYVDARTGLPYDDSYGSESTESGRERYEGRDSGGPGMMSKAADAAKAVGHGIAGAASTVAGAASTAAGAASSAASSVAGAASSARQRAGDMTSRAGEYADSGSEYAGRARGAASDYGRQARDWSGQAYGSASHGMRRGADYGRETFQQSLERYPLAVVAAALAGGMLTGLLFPATRRENRLMGEQSDQLKDSVKTQIRDTGETMLDKGKEMADATMEVANATAGAVTEEADKQGVSPDTLAEKVKTVARDTAGAAKESARREGLTDVGKKGKDIVDRGKEAAKGEARQQKDRMTQQ